MINSGLWILAAVFCVYATTYGVLTLDWKRFVYGVIVLTIFSISQVVIAIVGD